MRENGCEIGTGSMNMNMKTKTNMKTKSLMFWISCLLLSSPLEPAAEVCIPEFEARPSFVVGGNFGTSVLGDFDEDGDLDLSVGLRLFLGNGTGGFTQSVQLRARIRVAFDVKFEDFDQDGHRDLAMVTFGSEELTVFYGRGGADGAEGLFEDAVYVDFSSAATGIWHIDVADFNDDGLPDLVGIAIRGRNLLILMNEGDRKYSWSGYPMGVPVNHMLATGDFDGDGNTDIATGRGADVTLLFGNGDGTFGREHTGVLLHDLKGVPGHRFRAADIDRDGRSDLFATGASWILIFLGKDIDPDSRKMPDTASLTLEVSGGARFLEIEDMNLDGSLDVVTLAQTPRGSAYQVFFGENSEAGVSFVAGGAHVTALSGHGSVLAVGGMNRDDFPDLVLTTEDTQRGQVFLSLSDCSGPEILAGDANADASVNISDATTVLTHLFAGGVLPCPAAADVNGDGGLNITDALYLLGFLFGGGPAPLDPTANSCDGG